jgi:hypothetical protein
MNLGDHSREIEIEAELARFEKENPELTKTIKLMGLTIEKYNNIMLNLSSKDVVTSNTTEG